MSGFDLQAQLSALDPEDARTLQLAVELGQSHLLSHWPPPGQATADKQRQLQQLRSLDGQYPGGLRAYVDNARTLLAASARGDNPYAGYRPEVPDGARLALGTPAFHEAEATGLRNAGRCGFVLVAGGLGERLGYSGIKIALPAETATGRSFIALYVQQLLALQARGAELTGEACRVPLAIMTSDDTHAATEALLAAHDNFGMAPDQITLIKQEKVPSLIDNEAHFAQSEQDPYAIETKPHGHGDVHVLMHGSGLAQRWLDDGVRFIGFFQDTNGLVFHAMPAALGVTVAEDYEVSSIVVPRRAGEAAGGIVRLAGEDRTLTINVEYNQLDPLLRATINPEGDVADDSGYSPYPGNINVLLMQLQPYVKRLGQSGGAIPEFVNPKYADAERTTFKKPTRLECMMQDYPKLLPADARVGFVQFERGQCFSAVKNAIADAAAKHAAGLPPESAGTGEADLYALHRGYLAACGAELAEAPPQRLGGIDLPLFPIVVLSPALVTDLARLKQKLRNVKLTAGSALVLMGDDIDIDGLQLDGALVIDARHGARVEVRGLSVQNAGWEAAPLPPDATHDEETAMRGFSLLRHATETLRFEGRGVYRVGD